MERRAKQIADEHYDTVVTTDFVLKVMIEENEACARLCYCAQDVSWVHGAINQRRRDDSAGTGSKAGQTNPKQYTRDDVIRAVMAERWACVESVKDFGWDDENIPVIVSDLITDRPRKLPKGWEKPDASKDL